MIISMRGNFNHDRVQNTHDACNSLNIKDNNASLKFIQKKSVNSVGQRAMTHTFLRRKATIPALGFRLNNIPPR